MKIKEIFYAVLPRGLKNSITRRQLLKQNYSYISFAQEGEDKILEKYFDEHRNSGFFVDIGANHPYNFSNTYKFYLKGWRGMNIDAIPGTKKLFDTLRPGDINVETGISMNTGVSDFYIFEQSIFNTFDIKKAAEHCREFSLTVKEVIKIKTNRLSEVLDNYLPASQKIDFISVDVEGLDMEVLLSNDWLNYKPEVILIECLHSNLEEIGNIEAVTYLRQLGYKLFAKTFNTLFFSIKSDA